MSREAELIAEIERLKAEIAAERTRGQAASQLYKGLIETSHGLVFMVDLHGRFTFLNAEWEEALGYPRSELIGRRFAEFKRPEVTARDMPVFRRVIEQQAHVYGHETSYLTRDGGEIDVLINARPTRDEAGRMVGLQGVGIDITARKQLEARLAEGARLEAVGQLAGGIAHDFNNLLLVINGICDLIRERGIDDEQLRGDIDGIREAGSHARELTAQLLAYGRRQVLSIQPLDLNAVLADTGRMLRRVIGEDIAYRWQPCDERVVVRADRGQLQQVLVNLAVNARHAMPDGGRLTVSTDHTCVEEPLPMVGGELPAGCYVSITARDTGVGMDEATRKHIFDPFFTTRGVGEGSGLGLATVFGIVGQHSGGLQVESSPGQGSTFRILLPCTDAEPVSEPEPVAEPVESPPATILLVEDDRPVRKMIVRALKREGYFVLVAENGAAALEVAEARADGEIDLLLTDVVMPEMNGMELAAILRRRDPDLRVLLSSGYPAGAVFPEGRPPHTHFLAKPYRVGVLREIISKLLTD